MPHFHATTVLLTAGSIALGQPFDPPPPKTPDTATLRQIAEQTAKLKTAVAAAVPDPEEDYRADLEVYLKAAEWIVRHQEWFTADAGKQTLAVLAEGASRAESARKGQTPWLDPAGRAVGRGYRSSVDGSVQPYGVVYPAGYGKDPTKEWRLDVHLHGRDNSLTEVKFLNQHDGRRPAPNGQDYVQLNIYGRGNNAYRWAGETDVFEAMEYFLAGEAAAGRKDLIDRRRIVLKGFSMGGAGTWHLGLRHPDRFAALQPGAGFTATHGYVAKLPDRLPPHQEACLRIYDAYRYAENAFNIPIVAYSGEKDRQRQAAENVEAELKRLGLADRMTRLIGPGLEHKFPPEWQQVAQAELRKHVGEGKGRPDFPGRVRFVTFRSAEGRCHWVGIDGLERQYEAARIDARWDGTSFHVTTENVWRMRLIAPPGGKFPTKATIDGQAVEPKWNARHKEPDALFAKRDGRWQATWKRLDEEGLRKIGMTTGPLDQAFTQSFLCVLGTGRPFHPETGRAAQAQFDRFRQEWDKYMRGLVRVKKDTDVTAEDLQTHHLILFGDPASNSQIKKAMTRLPIRWTADELDVGGTKYDARTHLPMLIYPGVHHPGLYVVLNSGHTFHDADFRGTNALLYPRLGDFAVVRPAPTAKDPAAFEVITAGLFDEAWRFPEK